MDDHKCHYLGQIGTVTKLGDVGATRNELMYDIVFARDTFDGGRGHWFFETELQEA